MIAKIELDQTTIENVLKNHIQVKLGTGSIKNFKLLVKSKNNYKPQEWENACVIAEGAADILNAIVEVE